MEAPNSPFRYLHKSEFYQDAHRVHKDMVDQEAPKVQKGKFAHHVCDPRESSLSRVAPQQALQILADVQVK